MVLGVDYDESALKTFQNNHGTATAMKLDLYNHDNITCIVDFLKDNNIENLDVLVGDLLVKAFHMREKWT